MTKYQSIGFWGCTQVLGDLYYNIKLLLVLLGIAAIIYGSFVYVLLLSVYLFLGICP